MERRRLQLANSHESEGGGASLEFPIYLKTKEGSGADRTRDADELSLKIVDWFFENKGRGGDDISVDLSDDEIIYVDEFRLTTLILFVNSYINFFWDNMGFWEGILELDGTIHIYNAE